MKSNKFIVVLFFLIAYLNSNAQRTNQLSASQFSAQFFPKMARTATMINCNPTLQPPFCNYIQNNQFNTTANPYSSSDPFGLNQVSFWSNSHGQPDLAFVNFGISVPLGSSNYAMMAVQNNNVINQSDGIVQKIATTQIGSQYLFRFWELKPSYASNSPMGEVNIYLIKCVDYHNFNVNSYTLPAVPTQSQRIFCETNLQTSITNNATDWKNRVVKFTANDNYDMIWIAPKGSSTGFYPQGLYCFGLPELINKSNYTITMNPTNPTIGNCNVTLTACNVYGGTVTWTSQSGITLNGNSITVDASNSQNVGTWTATLNLANVDVSNSTCGNDNFTITATVNVPNCSCINLPLIQ